MNNTVNSNTKSNVFEGRFRRTLVQKIVGRFKEWSKRREAIRQLNDMPDSFLRDIGIERYQISDVVNQKGAFAELKPAQPKVAKTTPAIKQAA